MGNPVSTRAAKPGRVEALQQALAEAQRFIKDDLWDRDVTVMPRRQRLLFSLGRICTIVVRGFMADNCGLQASALTYISLMSMIPVLAMMFSFSKGIGMQNRLIEAIGLERTEAVELVDGKESLRARYIVAGRAKAGSRAANTNGTSQYALDSLPEPMQKVVTTVFSYVENTSFGALGFFEGLETAVVLAQLLLDLFLQLLAGVAQLSVPFP